MFNYISSFERNNVEYKIFDSATLAAEVICGDEPYDSFVEAIKNANGACALRLVKDITLKEVINIKSGVDVTLNLNGHNITADSTLSNPGGMFAVWHGGSLTIEGNGIINAATNPAGRLYGAIQLCPAGDSNDAETAKVVINSGKIIGYYYAIVGNGATGRGNTSVIINGGELRVTNGTAIYNPQMNSIVTINGGEITGAEAGIGMRAGDLIVNNGYIESLLAPASTAPNNAGAATVGCAIGIAQHITGAPINVSINGGVMTGYHALYEVNPQKNSSDKIDKVVIKINGGAFMARGSDVPVYSEDKTAFIYDGIFSHPVKEEYKA